MRLNGRLYRKLAGGRYATSLERAFKTNSIHIARPPSDVNLKELAVAMSHREDRIKADELQGHDPKRRTKSFSTTSLPMEHSQTTCETTTAVHPLSMMGWPLGAPPVTVII